MNLDGVCRKLNTHGWNVNRTASDSLKDSILRARRKCIQAFVSFQSFLFFIPPFTFHRAPTCNYLSRDLAEWVANILAPREPRAERRRLLKVRRRRVVIGVVVGVKELPLKRAFFEKSRTLSSSFWLHQQQWFWHITFSETCFNSSVRNKEINISGYHVVRLDWASRRGAGVCSYVRSSLQVSILDITSTSDGGFQQLWFTVQHKKLKPLVVRVAYRPPDAPLASVASDLTSNYSKAAMLRKDIIILGDLNCDMLSPTKPECRIISELCSLLNLIQLISKPTRVTETTRPLIDVILTSNNSLIKQNNVLQTTISNQFLASCKLTLKRPKSVPLTITTRSFKNFNTDAFCKDNLETPWDTISIFDHIDDQISSFNDPLPDILDQHAPIKSSKAKHKKSHVITAEIRELTSKRDDSFKYSCMATNPLDWRAYRILRQKVRSYIRVTESRHVKEEIANNLSKNSSIWKIVRGCLNSHGSSNF